MKLSSFISEHSIELILIPAIINILKLNYCKVTPLYYWSSREGGSIATKSFNNKELKIIALFPRRPKINNPKDSKIYIKLNQVLYDRSSFFNQNGILTIAGLPLCKSLDCFHTDTKLVWFELMPEGFERIITFDLASNNLTNEVPLLNKEELLVQINQKTKALSWLQFREVIRKMNQQNFNLNRWYPFSGSLYKPIYLILQ